MDSPVVEPIAWEQRERYGPLSAFFLTVRDVLSRPAATFERLQRPGPIADAITFWAIAALPPLAVGGLSAASLVRRLPQMLDVDPAAVTIRIPGWLFFPVGPLLQFGALLFSVLIVHGMLRLIGATRSGSGVTLRAAGYASAPAVVGLVPVVGGLVAGVWVAFLQYMAIRRVHQVRHRDMVLAYVLPAAAIVMLGVAAAAALLAQWW